MYIMLDIQYDIKRIHCSDIRMGAMASQITSLTIVYFAVDSGTDQRKRQSSAWLAFVRGIHRWPVNSPHKWPVTRKMFPFDDVVMLLSSYIPQKTVRLLTYVPNICYSLTHMRTRKHILKI